MTLHIVFVEPEIPPNTGNIARTCAATGTKLHLVEPLGFSIEDKALKRAGLDYWEYVDLEIHKNLKDFLEKYEGMPMYLSTTKAEKIYKRSCATCHGKSGEKPAMGESKIINQLNAEEISSALFDHKSGKIVGAGNPAKQRLSDEEIHALSEFIPGLK